MIFKGKKIILEIYLAQLDSIKSPLINSNVTIEQLLPLLLSIKVDIFFDFSDFGDEIVGRKAKILNFLKWKSLF